MTVTALLPSFNILNNNTKRADDLMSSNENNKLYVSTPKTSSVPNNNTYTTNIIPSPQNYSSGKVVKTEFTNNIGPLSKKIQLPPISSFDKLITAIKNENTEQTAPKIKLENQDYNFYDTLHRRRSRTGSVPISGRQSLSIPILSSNTNINNKCPADRQALVPTPDAAVTSAPNSYFPALKSQSSSPSMSTAMASPVTLATNSAPYLLPSASSNSSMGTVGSALFQSPQYYVQSCASTSVSTPRSELDIGKNFQIGNDSLLQSQYQVPKLASLPSQSPTGLSRRSSNGSQGDYNNKNRKKRECPICHKFFANLSTHKSTHLTSQDRPHKCVICQRGFARNNDLIRHKKRHWKDNLDVLANPELSGNVELQQDSIAKQRELKKNQLKSLHQIKGAFQCPYNTNLIEVDLELYKYKAQSGVLNFKPIDCHQTGVFSRCDTYKNHLKALHFEYPPRTKREQRGIVPGRCRHCGEKFPNVDVWLNQHVGKTCGFPYH
ncbi:Zinc finger protein STP4 [Nakaseomyces bracarensis]|uniref:Zinc finger protein STP4 n=1 Tax=Nakaseomyces bracarensis TaxID=273131 RepID=A0ABR4NNF0_9SACH